MPQNHFDEPVAAVYDEVHGSEFDPVVLEPAVERLAELAGNGRALEFAIGTGRVALPLSARGVDVSGIELSDAMASRLRAKPGADAIDVTIGDMTTTRADGHFRLVYLVFNTINNLTSQDEQIECFRNAASHLETGGCFLIEVGVPALGRLAPGTSFIPWTVQPDYVGVDEFTDLTEAQVMYSHHYRVIDGKFALWSAPFRYVWPSELDLMARIAGLSLRSRWSDWSGTPFTSDSAKHVSVWEKLPA